MGFMVLGIITAFGRRFRLRLVLEEATDSLPPPTFDTTATEVEPSSPVLAKTRPALRVVREVA